MTSMYPIATRFSLAARRNAANREYEKRKLSRSSRTRYQLTPLDPELWQSGRAAVMPCFCPIGIMLITDRSDGKGMPAPAAEDLAEILTGRSSYEESSDEWYAIADEAAEFILDWDGGKIDDLYAALGLT